MKLPVAVSKPRKGKIRRGAFKKAMVMFYLVANQGASHYPGTARCLSKPVLFSKNILGMPLIEGYFLEEKTER